MLNGPNKTCLLGRFSAQGWPASSSAAEPQKAEENVCSRKVRSIMHVLEKDHPGPGVRDGARIGGATKKESASRAQRWRRMDGFEDTTVALASSWASLG